MRNLLTCEKKPGASGKTDNWRATCSLNTAAFLACVQGACPSVNSVGSWNQVTEAEKTEQQRLSDV